MSYIALRTGTSAGGESALSLRPGTARAGVLRGVLILAVVIAYAPATIAQTIRVDTTPGHATNSFVPTRALGAGIDRLPKGVTDKVFTEPVLKQMLSAGWQPVSYRQNTELFVEAWHWNPQGTWSDPAGKGYFTGNATPSEIIRHSYGYPLPHRGFTRNEGTETSGYSRLTDGDPNSYWKSNPYLSQAFTAEDDSLHPQWVILDLANNQEINAIRIAWAEPYARRYLVQYWTGEDPIKQPTKGVWQTFPAGTVTSGKGGTVTLELARSPISLRYVRVLMTQGSNTCDTHGAADRRNCLGYAIRELFIGTSSPDGEFYDLARHAPDQDQTTTFCSSVDPWHEPSDVDEKMRDQVGFDLFFTSGVTRGLPAIVPVAMLYDTPENAAAEIAYLEKRGYPVSYVEMGEEADGQYMLPEDYGALYVQWATAIHRVDPKVKLGGPAFQGVNKDIEVWPDAQGRTSWLGRFLDYLKAHGRLADLAFFSFEHYPFEPCKIEWSSLYDEPTLVSHILDVWRGDGLPRGVPMLITESNISWQTGENSVDIFGALWLADYVGAFLTAGGDAVYYFHYVPGGLHRGCNESVGTFGMFVTNSNYEVQQYTSQFFASQLINLEWVQPGDGTHRVFPASSDMRDPAGHNLVTVYAVVRPDSQWSLLVVNKDQENAHRVRISFHDSNHSAHSFFSGTVSVTTFGAAQYQWHPTATGGSADPDGPAVKSTVTGREDATYTLPKASITVLKGKIEELPASRTGSRAMKSAP